MSLLLYHNVRRAQKEREDAFRRAHAELDAERKVLLDSKIRYVNISYTEPYIKKINVSESGPCLVV